MLVQSFYTFRCVAEATGIKYADISRVQFFSTCTKKKEMDDVLYRLQVLDEKIRYAEQKYNKAVEEQVCLHTLKSLKVRINNLYKERSLYHDYLQPFKESVPFLSPVYKKIESIHPFQSSRYA